PQQQWPATQHVIQVLATCRVVDPTPLATHQDHAQLGWQGHHPQAGPREIAFSDLKKFVLVHGPSAALGSAVHRTPGRPDVESQAVLSPRPRALAGWVPQSLARLDARGPKLLKAAGCEVTDLARTDRGLTFTRRDRGLPF